MRERFDCCEHCTLRILLEDITSTTIIMTQCIHNFVPYLRQLVFAAILWVKLSEMFITLLSLEYASSAS